MKISGEILDRLYKVVVARKDASPESSYTAKLFDKGLDTILKKLGEEATETVIAGKGGTDHELTHEAADLCYHLMVLLAARGIEVSELWKELEHRFGISGIEEKASRKG